MCMFASPRFDCFIVILVRVHKKCKVGDVLHE